MVQCVDSTVWKFQCFQCSKLPPSLHEISDALASSRFLSPFLSVPLRSYNFKLVCALPGHRKFAIYFGAALPRGISIRALPALDEARLGRFMIRTMCTNQIGEPDSVPIQLEKLELREREPRCRERSMPKAQGPHPASTLQESPISEFQQNAAARTRLNFKSEKELLEVGIPGASPMTRFE